MTRLVFFLALACSLHSLYAAPPSPFYYVGSGYTMGPRFTHGEILNAIPIDFAHLRAGRIVAFYVPELNETVAHRLVRITENGSWITKGDTNEYVDPWPLTRATYLAVMVKYRGYTDFAKARPMEKRLENVYVINLYSDPFDGFRGAIFSQHSTPPLYSVPEPGATVGLLALGLGFLFAVVRWSSAE